MSASENGKRGVREEFDAKAAHYESNRLAGWYRAHNDIIAAHLNPGKDDTLLDIGCATGYLIRRTLGMHPGMSAIGVDLAPGMVAAARREAGDVSGRARFFCDDWEAPGSELRDALQKRDVDLAVCASGFHYFGDPVGALRRIRQSLVPGGALFLLERRRERSLSTIAWDLAHRYLVRDHVRFYDSAELCGMIGKAGFSHHEIVRTVRKIFWKNKVSSNLILIKAVR
ncbi:class I SAM-dependent methyltransferase [Roseovarius sp. D22-M7]|uniref:class I SAM-dependent methyltransferase n=1 Tax=Roseovarius sp. D22-M7 TaxID=3127116 RepID=UPI00300FABF1